MNARGINNPPPAKTPFEQYVIDRLQHIDECTDEAKDEARKTRLKVEEALAWQKAYDAAEVKQATLRAERRRWFSWGYWAVGTGLKHRVELMLAGAVVYGLLR